jgi:uncharacterized protein YcfL
MLNAYQKRSEIDIVIDQKLPAKTTIRAHHTHIMVVHHQDQVTNVLLKNTHQRFLEVSYRTVSHQIPHPCHLGEHLQ